MKDPQKIGDGISSFLTYSVVTRTNVGLFKKSETIVSRRFSDFLGLHEKLAEKYLHKGRIVPTPPEKNVVGMCILYMSNCKHKHSKRKYLYFICIWLFAFDGIQAQRKSK